ncbi:hypothetical protein ACFQD2_01625 [Pseudomonas lini]
MKLAVCPSSLFMGFTMKIKNKLVLTFVLVAFIPVSLVAAVSVTNTRTLAADQFMDGSTREIRQIDGNIRQFFEASLQMSIKWQPIQFMYRLAR